MNKQETNIFYYFEKEGSASTNPEYTGFLHPVTPFLQLLTHIIWISDGINIYYYLTNLVYKKYYFQF